MLKWGGEYLRISPAEVMWKAVAAILDFCFTASIIYQKLIHGFLSGRSTGAATLKVKLLH